MSEPENLNFDLPDRPVNPEQVLSELAPQPLAISRDELFFHAGFAAGSHRLADRIFWRSAVAALLLVCVGLGAATMRQVISINSLRTELAAAERGFAQSVARNGLDAAQQTDKERSGQDRLLADQLQRGWLRLASANPLPPGRLTAMGWEEMPRDQAQEIQPAAAPAPDSASPPPKTYLELMRLQTEG